MILREASLPPGWYPRDRVGVEEFLRPIIRKNDGTSAAVAPHAGWYYSGLCAARAVSSLNRNAETVVVIGGHLPVGMPILVATEDAVKTPLGILDIDVDLRGAFQKLIEIRPDYLKDNTVEVLLPMVHYYYPEAKLLWLRFPAAMSSFDAGKLLSEAATSLGRNLAVLASTDLTHYGDNYGFSPRGRGRAALEWAKKENDAAFIAAVLEGDPAMVLKCAEEDHAACSAGAVLGALGFASSKGAAERRLLEYSNSADVNEASQDEVPDSFVGYAAISLG